MISEIIVLAMFLAWVSCGVLAVGIIFHGFYNKYPPSPEDEYDIMPWFVCIMAGPVILAIALLDCMLSACKPGLIFFPARYWEKRTELQRIMEVASR